MTMVIPPTAAAFSRPEAEQRRQEANRDPWNGW